MAETLRQHDSNFCASHTAGIPVYFTDSATPPAMATLRERGIQPLEAILSEAYTHKEPDEVQALSFEERHRFLSRIAIEQQEQRWENITGVTPEETRFILGTPVYNERRMGITGMTMATVMADIPASAHVDHVFVTNRCSDGSEDMVQSFLERIGEVTHDLPIEALGDFSFDPKIAPNYSLVQVGNHRFIHIDTQTGSKANVWRILTEMAIAQDIPIVMSHDTNVFVTPDGPAKLYKEAYQSFVQKQDNAVIISAVTPEYVHPDSIDPLLKDTGLSPRQILPFGLLVPKHHQVNGKFAAWDPTFYSNRAGRGIPLSKLDDVVMAKHADMHGRSFRHVDDILSHEWGVPTLKGRQQMLKRFTTGYHQMGNGLGLRSVSPELRFFEDQDHREQVLFEHAKGKPELEKFLPLTVQLWHEAAQMGYVDFQRDPHNPAFEAIEGSK